MENGERFTIAINYAQKTVFLSKSVDPKLLTVKSDVVDVLIADAQLLRTVLNNLVDYPIVIMDKSELEEHIRVWLG